MLWQYRIGAAQMRRGDFGAAKRAFDEALPSVGVMIANDKDAQKARSVFHKESRKRFLGEPHERVMACYYRGILYWMDGEPDNARACFRSGAFLDQGNIISPESQTNRYSADYVLLDYLDGLATTKLGGDGSEAFARAQGASKLATPPPCDPSANVLFFVEFGLVPSKVGDGKHRERLRYEHRDSPARSAMLRVSGRETLLPAYDDLYYQATTRGGRLMDDILASKAQVRDVTSVAGDIAILTAVAAAANRNENTALIAAGVGVFAKAAAALVRPEADTRMWDNLPNHLTFAAIQLPPGEHTATVEFLGSAQQVLPELRKLLTFVVEPGHDKVIFVSDHSTTSQTLSASTAPMLP